TIRNSIVTSDATSRRNSKTSSSLNVGQSDVRCTLVFLRFIFFPLRSYKVTLTQASGYDLVSMDNGRKFFASITTIDNLAALCK
ncbi:unnamed protein product, partial [Rotaria socialis]